MGQADGGEITFDDCCRIILEDWFWRREEIDAEVRDYKHHLLAVLNDEFGIAWADDGSREMKGTPYVALHMPRIYQRIEGPFTGHLEYNYKPGEFATHERHLDRIDAAEQELKRRWVAMFRDLLLLRWPDAADRTTSWARLRMLGLGEAPDMSEYGT